MKTKNMLGAILMQHGDKESYISNIGSVIWKDNKLNFERASYTWPSKLTELEIKRQMMECLTPEAMLYWMYLMRLLRFLSFKIPIMLYTHGRGEL